MYNEYGSDRAQRLLVEKQDADALHQCRCCGEECPDGIDCCSDDFPEPGDTREMGR